MYPAIAPIMLGKVQPFRGEDTSAIAKHPATGAVGLGLTGFAGDEQADRRVHGGPDKAVHHYPYDHYALWAAEWGGHDLLARPGAFGENISTIGLTEDDVHIGDRFRLGGAVIEVSHGRQPCWKLDHRFGQKGVMARIIKTGRCGWYYRVIETGHIRAGDRMELIAQGQEKWTIARVFALLIGGGHKAEPGAIQQLALHPQLAQAWRERAAKLSGN